MFTGVSAISFFFKEINILFSKNELIKSDSQDMYNPTKDFYLK